MMNRTYIFPFTLISILLLIISTTTFAQKQLNDSINFQNTNRNYSVYIPKSLKDSLNPLVFIFHGTGGDGEEFLNHSNLRSISDTAGFLIVSPSASDSMNRNWSWYKPEITGVDDPAFISTLIDTLIEKFNIDINRIYCTGHSRGGIFCYALACNLGEKIAAIAPIAGTMLIKDLIACEPLHPTPIFHVHGTNDRILPYTGRDYRFMPVPMVLDFWCNKNKVDNKSIIRKFTSYNYCDNKFDETIIYGSEKNEAVVKFVKVNEGKHEIDLSKSYENTNKNIAEEIWIFFNNYRLDQW